jgi:hypothetical protein
MIFTPFEPSAGPTGGAGVAFPASKANFINPITATPKKKIITKNPKIETLQNKNIKGTFSFFTFLGLSARFRRCHCNN